MSVEREQRAELEALQARARSLDGELAREHATGFEERCEALREEAEREASAAQEVGRILGPAQAELGVVDLAVEALRLRHRRLAHEKLSGWVALLLPFGLAGLVKALFWAFEEGPTRRLRLGLVGFVCGALLAYQWGSMLLQWAAPRRAAS